MKNRTWKKALSLMLVAALTLSLSCITVFAEDIVADENAATITELPAEAPGDTQAPEAPEVSEDPTTPPVAEPTAEPEQPLTSERPEGTLSEYAISVQAEGSKQKDTKTLPDTVNAKVYLYYNNTVPDEINQGFPAADFGPNGNDTPYFEVTVNIAKLLADGTIKVQWTNNNTRWYISEDSPGAQYNSAYLWSKILACMSEADQTKFAAIGAGTYMGYVLKNEGTPHIDGILDVKLPYYRTELYIDGQFAKDLVAEDDMTHKENDIKNEFATLLQTKYGDSNLAVNWGNQTFTSGEMTYHFELNAASHGTQGVGFVSDGKQNYERQNNVNFYLACQYIDIDPLEVPTFTVSYVDENASTVLQAPIVVRTGDNIPIFSGTNPTKASDNNNTYVFSGWVLHSGTLGNNGKVGTTNLVYKAVYTPTARQYRVSYIFVSGTAGKALPEGLIPSSYGFADVTNAGNGAIYTTSQISGSYDDSVNDGVWTFQSWSPATQTIGGSDITFTGTWRFTANTHTLHVNYVFTDNQKPATGFEDYSTPGFTQGSPYSAVAIEAPAGYHRSVNGNTSGQFGSTDITVTYTYTPNGSETVHVQYFLEGTETQLRDEQTKTGLLGTAYSVLDYKLETVLKDGRFYDLVDAPDDDEFSGTYVAGGKNIDLYYAERTYSAPYGQKIVSGLSSLPSNYQVTLELRGPDGGAIATAVLSAEDFERQENGTFVADFRFDAPMEELPVLFATESHSLPAGTYTVVETSINSVSGMNLAAPAYALTIFRGEETPTATATNQIPIGVNGENAEYLFTVTNTYSAIYYPPTDPTPNPPVEIPEEETPLTPTPPVVIPEEETPMNPAPGEESAVEIVEEEPPLAVAPTADKTIPQTGDNSATALFAILAVLSATGLAALTFGTKKREQDSN